MNTPGRLCRPGVSFASTGAFTLIELMIVVAIIGILAAIAIPNFVKFQCRSKQSEVRGNLKALVAAEESYRAEHDSYLGVVADVANGGALPNATGFTAIGGKIRYTYSVTAACPDGSGNFLCYTAFGNGFADAVDGDQWTVTQDNQLVHAFNACE